MLARLDLARLAQATVLLSAIGGAVAQPALADSSTTGGSGTGASMPPNAQRSATDGSSVAYAVPRNAPAANVEIVLPQPLPPSVAVAYERIIDLQSRGSCAEADKKIARLDDETLKGEVLAARYVHAKCHASNTDLQAWLANYSNEPEAPSVYKLLPARLPAAQRPAAPVVKLLPETTTSAGAAARPTSAPDGAQWRRDFVTGLSLWKQGNISKAGGIFSRTAQMAGISADDRAASAFWAARADLRTLQPNLYLEWLGKAASAPDTFYGMLAGRLLGQGFGPTGIAASLSEADVTAVDAQPDGHLAFALLQVGENEAAATALRALWPQMRANPDLARAVMAVAARAGLVDVTIAIAGTFPSPVDEIAGARLPLPALHPSGGFTVDPALVYALARTESGFDTHAVSRCGARGLMQIMPMTARYVREQKGLTGALNDPSGNLALGQAYVRYLGEQSGINDNLIAILASYNAGPGAASAWANSDAANQDPLLYIESIPNNETRRFVRQVLADSWLYAEEIGLQPKTLDQLAQGNFPTLDTTRYTEAAN